MSAGPAHGEGRLAHQSYAVTNLSDDRILLYLRTGQASAALRNALQKVVSLRRTYQEAVTERQRFEARVQEIGRDQAWTRENMGKLERASSLYSRYVTILDEQETELQGLAASIDAAKAKEDARKKELDAFILSLDVS